MKKNTIFQPTRSASFLLILLISCVVYNPLQAQDCFIQFERISDNSVRIVSSGGTTNVPNSRQSFFMPTPDFFDTNPSSFTATVTENTLLINGEGTHSTVSTYGASGSFGFNLANSVGGTLSATGSAVLTYPVGTQIKPIGTVLDFHHSTPGGGGSDLICQVGIVAESSGGSNASIPTLSEWGLIVLALFFMTLGTLYLLQPEFNKLQKEKV